MSKEALKQARQIIWRYRHETPVGNQPYWIAHEADETIERIDKAIAEAEKQEQCKYPNCDYPCMNLPDCREQGEPVAKLFGTLPVYDTAPPQRTWVGLTKGEVYDLYDSDYAVFYQRIEAKLKEKNT